MSFGIVITLCYIRGMEGIKHIQYLNDAQERYINLIQGTTQIKKNKRINKSQATGKIIDWAIKSGFNVEDIIK